MHAHVRARRRRRRATTAPSASAPTLAALRAAAAATDDELVVVDNASRDGTARSCAPRSRAARVLETGENLGFAGGCHAGARGDARAAAAVPQPRRRARARLPRRAARRGAERPDWGAWQALVTLPGGERVNTGGNVVHYLGFGWAGRARTRRSAAVDARPHEVGFRSGAALVVRREAWDARRRLRRSATSCTARTSTSSLRLRLAGWRRRRRAGRARRARLRVHKGDYKWFCLERNRWWTLLGAYPGALLALLAPALLAFEVALLLAAWRGGWLRAKLRAQAAVLRSLPAMLRRRRAVQATRRDRRRRLRRARWRPRSTRPTSRARRASPGWRHAASYWRAVRAALG